jgi:5-methylcytosine-specific restriction endonuclease McrA
MGRRQAKRLRRIRRRLWANDPTCFYCGGWLRAFRWATLDHIRPRCEGGDDREENLVLACRRCNGRKSSLPFEIVAVQRFRGCGLLSTKHLLKLAANDAV